MLGFSTDKRDPLPFPDESTEATGLACSQAVTANAFLVFIFSKLWKSIIYVQLRAEALCPRATVCAVWGSWPLHARVVLFWFGFARAYSALRSGLSFWLQFVE